MLVLGVVLAPAFAGGKKEPVAHIGDFGRPAAILFRQAFAPPEAVNDGFDLQKLGLGILGIVRPGDRALGAGAQFLLEVADLGVGAGLRFQQNEAPGVVVDLAQRLVDVGDALFDGFALTGQLGIEVGDFVDGVDVEQLLEARHKARQVVAVQLRKQVFVFKGPCQAGIHLGGFQLEALFEGGHGFDDFFGQTPQLDVFGINACLQPSAQVLLAVVAGLHAEWLFAQSFCAHGIEPCSQGRVDGHLVQQRSGLLVQRLRVSAPLLHLGAFVARALQFFASGFLCRLHAAQLVVELLEHVRGRLQPFALVYQLGNFGGQAGPIELVESGEFFKPGEGIQTAGERCAFGLNGRNLAAHFSEPRFKLLALGLQGCNFGAVAPAQHVAAAVLNAVAVVFFMPATGVFDLAGRGDGARLTAKLLLRGAARDVEPDAEFAFQPIVVGRVGLDGEFAHQGIAVQGRQFGGFACAHMKVNQAAPQVGAVYPFGHGFVMRIGHQKRQTKAAQQAFGGAFPVTGLFAHLNQFASERHVVHAQAQCRADGGADLDLLVVDVAAPALEAVDFLALLRVFLLALTQAHAVFGQGVLQVGIALQCRFSPALVFAALRAKGGIVAGQGLAQHGGQFTITAGLGLAGVAQLLFLANLGGKALQPVAAVVVDRLLEFIHFLALRLVHGRQFVDLGIHAFPLLRQ